MAYSLKVNFSQSEDGESQKEATLLLSSQIHVTPTLSVGV